MRLFVDNLTNIDFSYLCPERGLVGETWLANIELTGEPDQQGMICDFGVVKKQLRQWLDNHLDHCLLVPANAPDIVSAESDQQVSISLRCRDDSLINIKAPKVAVNLIDAPRITPSSVAQCCEKELERMFPNSVLAISFTCEDIKSPYYHYSHGLKKHGGDCQRIAHGHRSKLLIWRNGVLSQDLMKDWATKWSDIYIATREDCVADTGDMLTFEYEASQGRFRLTIPSARCYMIDTDTTVEYIAQHLANKIGAAYPADHIVVKAFEGIGKGAIAEANR
jgi:6-pyruvoyl-tetrahydropterin synthase